MHYHIYCNVRQIRKYHLSAIKEFQKRLSAYCSVTIHPSADFSLPREFNPTNHLLFYVSSGPSTYSSEEFAHKIKSLQNSGRSTIHIAIGYEEASIFQVLESFPFSQIPEHFSLTRSQLPVDTLSLLLLEQLYRGYTILQGKTYHK